MPNYNGEKKMEWVQINKRTNFKEVFVPLQTFSVELKAGVYKSLRIENPLTMEGVIIRNAGKYVFLHRLIEKLEQEGNHKVRKYYSPSRGSYTKDIYTADLYLDEILTLLDLPRGKPKGFQQIMNVLGIKFK